MLTRSHGAPILGLGIATLALLAGGAHLLGSASKGDADERALPPILAVALTDVRIGAPPTIPADDIQLRAAHDGAEERFVSVWRVEKGRSGAELAAALATGEAPAWATPRGGVHLREGTRVASAPVSLDAGPHVILAETADGRERAWAPLDVR